MAGFASVVKAMMKRKKEPAKAAPKSASRLSKNPRPLLSVPQQNAQGESGSGQGL